MNYTWRIEERIFEKMQKCTVGVHEMCYGELSTIVYFFDLLTIMDKHYLSSVE